MQDFQNLRVWRAAHVLVLRVYRATATFPEEERFGLTSQLRRAAASIGANIAESCGRSTDTDMRRYMQIALGSACEVLNHALLARDLGYLAEQDFLALERELSPVRGMLLRLIARLQQSGRGSRK